jgi:hypothetical protein
MKNRYFIFCCLNIFFFFADAQVARVYKLNSGWSSPLPRSNAINDVLVREDTIWFGTERGLSYTLNNGISWNHFSNTNTFDSKGISAIAIKSNNIWVATGYSSKLGEESVQTGGGLHYSTDRGISWNYLSQPVDQNGDSVVLYGNNRIRAMAVTVPQQNITFDIALTSSTVWIASWAGMLRKKPIQKDTAWTRVVLPPDNLDSIKITDALNYKFDLSPSSGRLGLNENNNHKLFSVYVSDDTTIWVGTAGGINKSTDGGINWRKFTHQNQVNSISGNWVLAIKEQKWNTKKVIWAATLNADNDEFKGISFSENGGESWNTALHGEWVHNIAINDSVVYAATDNGIFRSSDFGSSWIQSGTIYDPTNLQRFVSNEIYGVDAKGDTIWVGGPDGTAYTIDSPTQPFGSMWRIFRRAEQVSSDRQTYSFPNPFTPDNEPVRLHYSLADNQFGTQQVSIRIFDFAMLPVRTLIQNSTRLNGKEYDEIWDGKNDNHSYVANGVYFYRVEIGDQSAVWGKIMVLR